MRVLITSVGSATGVNLIKEFHKKGDYVVGTDINPYGYTAGSSLVDVFYQIVLAEHERYIDELLQIIKQERIDLMIPVNDIEIYQVSKHMSDITCKCIIPDVEKIETVRDKYLCNMKLQSIGVQVPEILDSRKNGTTILRNRIGVGSKGITIVHAMDSVPEYDQDTSFLQEYVRGVEYTVDVLSDLSGEPVYIIPRKRIEVKSGVATKVEIENNQSLIDVVIRILNEIKLPGFSNIQFIKDKNENYWFIEINPRFSGCGAATLAVTKDYLDCFKRIVEGKEINQDINQNVKWNTIVTRYFEECVYEKGIS